ncbi:GTP-binding protein [Salibacterium salarium]|uniref:Probable GTP-binding protein EngB n=1 Tax=Salibacterium salarium TaxID=284579 RepID=A0A3R9QS95_9BACI|nr:ribosome biogenesis GTP-binding protein YihA/YsxC [Salibacterium salarium]MDQ0298661.1 GTP-binding protein [Salibacterium salarium]RSL32246.1 YihA family ribosome biogenesis GTP-binding protein [Salibacterium salarium]
MKVNQAELMISAVSTEQYPQNGLPEIALAGRSNVGKSSFINTLLTRKNLAYTSSKPGKTQTLNFYDIEGRYIFVDVPGYGYAKVSKTERAAWGRMMETYFSTRESLRGVVLIIDVRHLPSSEDVQMYKYLKYFDLPIVIIATKADKVSKNKRPRHVKQIKETLEMEKTDSIILFSAETGHGKEDSWKAIKNLI